MRILIDECIDERFRNSLPGHDCQTARYAGLAGLTNGELLTAAEIAKFDVSSPWIKVQAERIADKTKKFAANRYLSCRVPLRLRIILHQSHLSLHVLEGSAPGGTRSRSLRSFALGI
jgi:hypothetical protein